MDSKIKEKIKNLLNRTRENGCTEGEAATAIKKVQQLLAQYSLTLEEITEDEIALVKIPVSFGSKSVSAAQRSLATNLAEHYGVSILMYASHNADMKIFGEEYKCKVFKEVLMFAYSAMMECWNNVMSNRLKNASRHDKLIARKDYVAGFIAGMCDELHNIENSTALVVTKSTALTEALSGFKKSGFSIDHGYGQNYAIGVSDGIFCAQNKNKVIE